MFESKRVYALLAVIAIAVAVVAVSGCSAPCDCPTCPPPVTCPTCPAPPPPAPTEPTCTGPTYDEWIDLGGTRILFPNGAAALDAESRRLLDEMVASVRSRTDILRVRVRGHTDSRGAAASNTRLSRERAESVIRYLVSLGVPETMFEPQGMGSTMPLADESSASERELNRRVDFQVLVRRCRTGSTVP